ncbi:MAG: pyridoxamine kinase [Defluviitaleaceae bacterium]|nr:pyridoxamine kinase [Defluviitaleaceae bacterium]
MKQKHVLAVHDISCIGRCSLTIALPVISAAGIVTSVMPTAVLSTHTGGFTEYTYRDLTDDMLPIADHWQTLSTSFDAIYTGYLGSQQQLDIVEELVQRFKIDDTLVVIDPVMADHGQLYKGFSHDFPQGMNKLCNCADVITPNITEALLMLSEPYKEGPYTKEYIYNILERLSSLSTSKINSKKVVLTGVSLETSDNEYGAATFENGDVHFSFAKKIPGIYHGTGDLFASVLTAALTHGHHLNKAADIAVKFTTDSIERTYKAGTDIKYGVNFESGLKDLLNDIYAQIS